MGAFSKLAERLTARNLAVSSLIAIAVWYYSAKRSSRRLASGPDLSAIIERERHDDGRRDKAAVDGTFFRKLYAILQILVPRVICSETGYLVVVAAALAARTYCDVWMIQNGTAIEAAIIGRSREGFRRHLLKYVYAMPAISLVNNLLKYGLSELKLRFRTRLTKHLYDKYLRGFTYYRMSNLDSRISNVDQLLTQDTEKFCDSVAELYSNLSKPLLDIVIYAVRLATAIGAQGPAKMFAYLVFSGVLLTRLRRPIGRMTMEEQKFEGEFRHVNSRLIANSDDRRFLLDQLSLPTGKLPGEEIAFYNGNKREQLTLLTCFNKLVHHLRVCLQFRFTMGLVDNIVAKYVATLVGYYVVSRPFLDLSSSRLTNSSHSERLEEYYQSGRMLVKMAEAIGRIVLAGRELTRLAGFTARITELIQVLNDLNQGKYQRTMVSDQGRHLSAAAGDGTEAGKQSSAALKPGNGRLVTQDHVIRFEQVPLVTPNGDVLIEDLTFEVTSGVNVLVCGPNGCGKSSLFRILGELWPLFGGTMTKPEKGKLFYVPQRPYMTLGTLRDQVIYPHSVADQKRRNITDRDLEAYLERVQLSYVLEREGGWDAVQDWIDVLSGGEKQRIAMARLFYHKPQFAILDECTSAVSVDVEGAMYRYCREAGITLFTVSHRKSLWQHHEYYLMMDGRGKYEFKRIAADTQEFGS